MTMNGGENTVRFLNSILLDPRFDSETADTGSIFIVSFIIASRFTSGDDHAVSIPPPVTLATYAGRSRRQIESAVNFLLQRRHILRVGATGFRLNIVSSRITLPGQKVIDQMNSGPK